MLLNDIRRFYENAALTVPNRWNLSRKHVRIALGDGSFLKLNRLRNRIGIRDLKYFCRKYAPFHVYFSVLDWLFPERVGKKHKAKYAVPIGGEYVFDVDSTNVWVPHEHDTYRSVCIECLSIAKELTLHICDVIEENYSNIHIVFSGRRGFHIHVFDFHYRDWASYNRHNPVKSHEVARFKYTIHLAASRYGFNRHHFIVATDPMRIITLPNSLNGESGLVCIPLGGRKTFENFVVEQLVETARLHAHPELYERAEMPTLADVSMRAMK